MDSWPPVGPPPEAPEPQPDGSGLGELTEEKWLGIPPPPDGPPSLVEREPEEVTPLPPPPSGLKPPVYPGSSEASDSLMSYLSSLPDGDDGETYDKVDLARWADDQAKGRKFKREAEADEAAAEKKRQLWKDRRRALLEYGAYVVGVSLLAGGLFRDELFPKTEQIDIRIPPPAAPPPSESRALEAEPLSDRAVFYNDKRPLFDKEGPLVQQVDWVSVLAKEPLDWEAASADESDNSDQATVDQPVPESEARIFYEGRFGDLEREGATQLEIATHRSFGLKLMTLDRHGQLSHYGSGFVGEDQDGSIGIGSILHVVDDLKPTETLLLYTPGHDTVNVTHLLSTMEVRDKNLPADAPTNGYADPSDDSFVFLKFDDQLEDLFKGYIEDGELIAHKFDGDTAIPPGTVVEHYRSAEGQFAYGVSIKEDELPETWLREFGHPVIFTGINIDDLKGLVDDLIVDVDEQEIIVTAAVSSGPQNGFKYEAASTCRGDSGSALKVNGRVVAVLMSGPVKSAKGNEIKVVTHRGGPICGAISQYAVIGNVVDTDLGPR